MQTDRKKVLTGGMPAGSIHSHVEVKDYGNIKKVYQNGDYVGYVEQVSSQWVYKNHIGYGGKAKTEVEAFAQLGFKVKKSAARPR